MKRISSSGIITAAKLNLKHHRDSQSLPLLSLRAANFEKFKLAETEAYIMNRRSFMVAVTTAASIGWLQ